MTYRPQIDALRALAIVAVIYAHFWDQTSSAGHLGVRLFFVISGYLITSILVEAQASGANSGAVWRSFVVRRALRIFPAYYALVAVILALNVTNAREAAPWALTYTTNILFALNNNFDPGQLAHTWSLAVEEQFYLLWPIVVLATPRRWLVPAILATIAGGLLFRAYALASGWPDLMHLLLLPGSLDALGAGALLACRRPGPRGRRALGAAGAAGAAVLLVQEAFQIWFGHAVDLQMKEALSLLAMVALVSFAADGRLPAFPFSAAPLLALGRISYGLYLYHPFVGFVLRRLFPLAGLPALERGPLHFVLGGAVAVTVAAVSWHVFEKPILGLKSRFPYAGRRAATAVGQPQSSGSGGKAVEPS